MHSNPSATPPATTSHASNTPQPLLDIEAAATYLNVRPRFIAQRRINYLKIGKFIRFEQTELNNWIQQQRVDAIQNARPSSSPWSV